LPFVVKFGCFYLVRALFSSSPGHFSSSPRPFYSVRPFSSRPGPFTLMGPFFKQKGPLPPMPSQAMMSLYYKPFGQSGHTFQHKGATFHPVNFCFIDGSTCLQSIHPSESSCNISLLPQQSISHFLKKRCSQAADLIVS